MPPLGSYALFLLAALTLLAIPGPAVIYIVGQSLHGGRRAGLASVAGVSTGTLVHTAAATAGLSAIVASSALAFDVVRFAGAAYLIVIGVRRFLGRDDDPLEPLAVAPRSLRRRYAQGVVVNILNPKTALFFLAFLPQFVDVSRGRVWLQVAVLGVSMTILGTLSDGTYAVVAGFAAERLRRRPGFGKLQRRVSGSLFVCLGAAAAAARR
jgi:threonine/homoserine/homoserine lactone efflux protein